MKNEDKSRLDPDMERYYSQGGERTRLDAALLEKDRTLDILRRKLEKKFLVIFDVGGAYGIYSYPLARMGHEVHLIDPIEKHIQLAHEYGREIGGKLMSVEIGDARQIARPDESADVVLFFGPLYHLPERRDRIKALKEAWRVLKRNGMLFASVISRYQSFIDNVYLGSIAQKIDVIKNDIITGLHPSSNSHMYLYFHHPRELKQELVESGFKEVELLGIEGPIWHHDPVKGLRKDDEKWKQLLDLLELMETDEVILGASAHVMGIARKP